MIVYRIFRRELLIDVHAQPRRLIDIHIPLLQLRRPRKNLPDQIVEEDRLLYPEIPDGQIDMTLRRMPHGRYVAGPMPAGTYIEELPEMRNLDRGSDAADLRDMTPEKIEIAPRDI